ncbi:hypothetical protein Tco_1424107 [Tanacetum coccineum]
MTLSAHSTFHSFTQTASSQTSSYRFRTCILTACCDDTSDHEFPDDDDSNDEDFPDDDDSSDEDFPELKVKKAKTCKGKSSKSSGCKTRAFNSSKTKVVSKLKTVKSPFLHSSDEDMSSLPTRLPSTLEHWVQWCHGFKP